MAEAGSGGQETFRTKRKTADGSDPAGTKKQGDLADRPNHQKSVMKVLEMYTMHAPREKFPDGTKKNST